MLNVQDLAAQCDFDCMGECDTQGLKTRPEVRDMCAANVCQAYGKSWVCPPACGPIEEYEARMRTYNRCLVVQTVGTMEDAFDFEAVIDAEELHKERFFSLIEKLRAEDADFMPLGAGTCRLCEKCSYPEAPCRFPSKQVVSMEAAGLVVGEVCGQAGIPYNHGENTIAFSSCILYS